MKHILSLLLLLALLFCFGCQRPEDPLPTDGNTTAQYQPAGHLYHTDNTLQSSLVSLVLIPGQLTAPVNKISYDVVNNTGCPISLNYGGYAVDIYEDGVWNELPVYKQNGWETGRYSYAREIVSLLYHSTISFPGQYYGRQEQMLGVGTYRIRHSYHFILDENETLSEIREAVAYFTVTEPGAATIPDNPTLTEEQMSATYVANGIHSRRGITMYAEHVTPLTAPISQLKISIRNDSGYKINLDVKDRVLERYENGVWKQAPSAVPETAEHSVPYTFDTHGPYTNDIVSYTWRLGNKGAVYAALQPGLYRLRQPYTLSGPETDGLEAVAYFSVLHIENVIDIGHAYWADGIRQNTKMVGVITSTDLNVPVVRLNVRLFNDTEQDLIVREQKVILEVWQSGVWQQAPANVQGDQTNDTFHALDAYDHADLALTFAADGAAESNTPYLPLETGVYRLRFPIDDSEIVIYFTVMDMDG